MTRSIAAFVICLVAGIALYPALVSLLVRLHAGQRIQEWVPATHRIKARTPTMGGVLFCLLVLVVWLLLDRTRTGFLVVFALVAGAAVGALDDVANIRGVGALGLLGRQKLVLQALVGLLVGIGLHHIGLTRQLFPGLGAPDLGWGIIVLTTLAVVAASNAVNLTDGIDGLAGSCSVFVFCALWALALHAGDRPTAIAAAAITGGVLAFLAYNWWPARVFMGDTGSLALGAALATLAAELGLLWLLPLLGLVFVAETLSVIINVTAIRRFHRRVFLASPLHHHFEQLGLREQRLVLTFAGVAAAGALLAGLAALPMGVGG